jgi:hypothetical protein
MARQLEVGWGGIAIQGCRQGQSMGLLPVATAYPLMSNIDVTLHEGRRQRTYAYIIQFTTVALHKYTYAKNIIF